MIFGLLLSLAAIAIIVVITEGLYRTGNINVEVSRKTIHIGTGTIIAFWPFFLPWVAIQLLSLLLLVAVVVSFKLHIFKSIHSVKRLTRGEILFPIGIGLCALLEPTPWVFTAAILHLAVADGLAGVIGVHYGKNTRYTILSHGKSLVGSLTFFVTSFVILATASFFISDATQPYMFGWFIWSALVLTFVENISWYGLDDITVPISVIVILTLLLPS
ncbi:MAG: diacylglycerol/polyprenol kinase family protein [Candidatus Saccharimonadales bacterium]